MPKPSCAVLLLALLGAAAHAQENVYVGFGFGGFDYEEKQSDPVFGSVGDTLKSYKLFGGFEFNDNFALEITYGETDDLMEDSTVVLDVGIDNMIFPNANVSRNLNLDYVKTSLRALGQVPLGNGVFFLGGVGWYRADGDVRQVTIVDHAAFTEPLILQDSFTLRNDGLMATLGLEWRFGRFGTRYGFRLEYEWWDIDEVNASTLGLAVSYGF